MKKSGINILTGLAALAFLAMAVPAAGELIGHGGYVKGVAVSPDGRHVMTASFDYSLILWDLAEQDELRGFLDHEGAVNAVAFLPDGRRAISGSDDGTVRLWDVERTSRLPHARAYQPRGPRARRQLATPGVF